MRRLTASKAQLALECAYWLRDDVPLLYEPSGPAAEEGTLLHAMIECHLRDVATLPDGHGAGLSTESQERVCRKYERWAAWAKTQRRIGWRPEVAFAYSPTTDTAKELVQKHHRDYSGAAPGDIAMQVDLVTFGTDGTGPYAEVIDWKSGRKQTASEDNAQVGVAALAISRCFGLDRVRVRLVYVGEDGVDVDDAWLEGMDLDILRNRLRAVLAKEQEAPRPGAHCTELWCNARHACPATVQALAEVSAQPLEDIRSLLTMLRSPEDAGRAYVQLRVIKDAVRAVEDRIKGIVEAHGSAPTSGGKVLRLVSTTKETFSKSRLPKERSAEVLDLLREVGALTESTFTSVREGSK